MHFFVRGSGADEMRARATADGLRRAGLWASRDEAPVAGKDDWRHLATHLGEGGWSRAQWAWFADTEAVLSCDLQVSGTDGAEQDLLAAEEVVAAVGANGGLLFLADDDLTHLCGGPGDGADGVDLLAQWAQVHGLALVLVLSPWGVTTIRGDGRTDLVAGSWQVRDPGGRGDLVARLLAAYARCPADLSRGLQGS